MPFDKILDMTERPTTVRRPRARPAVRQFTAALVAGDAAGAREIADAHLEATHSRLAVVSDLLHPAQYEIGELWYQGRLGVAEEHRATAIVSRVAANLTPTPVDRPVRSGARCLLSAISTEKHVVGLQLLAMTLEDEGWLVDVLQPPVPRAEMIRAVSSWRPDVVGLSAAYTSSLVHIESAIADLKKLRVPVMVGGPLFNRAPGLWRVAGADAHGSDARVTAVLMRRALR